MTFLFFEDISIVVGFTNFLVFITFIIINISAISLRYKKPHLKRKFKMPLNIGKFPLFSLFGILICLFLLFNLEWINIISGVGVSIVIFILYFLLNSKKNTVKDVI